MKTLFKTLMPALAMIILVTSSFAQMPMKAEKYENAKWYEMIYLKYKPGKADAARAFIEKNFVPVDQEIGRKVLGFDFQYGEWDQVVFFPLTGADEIGWKVSPTTEKWFSTFAKRQGGIEKAMSLIQEWEGFVADSKSALVRGQ